MITLTMNRNYPRRSLETFQPCLLTCHFSCLRLVTGSRLSMFVCADTDPGHHRLFTLPWVTGIIKSFLSHFPIFFPYSERHSSSALVCLCYTHSLFSSPQFLLAVDSLPHPSSCSHVTRSRGPSAAYSSPVQSKHWACVSLSDASRIYYSRVSTNM